MTTRMHYLIRQPQPIPPSFFCQVPCSRLHFHCSNCRWYHEIFFQNHVTKIVVRLSFESLSTSEITIAAGAEPSFTVVAAKDVAEP